MARIETPFPRIEVRSLTAAALGGMIGASCRWAVAQPLAFEPGEFPWDGLFVNVLGCLLIGAAAARLVRGTVGWAFAVTGVLGGFTTMSGFALGFNDLIAADRTVAAIAYFVVTMAGGVLALLAGRRFAR
jgi:CrcB protein